MKTVRRLDQLRRDADLAARLAHTALDDVGHAELPRDFRDRHLLALEIKRRRARRDL